VSSLNTSKSTWIVAIVIYSEKEEIAKIVAIVAEMSSVIAVRIQHRKQALFYTCG
jgi:hypothetical protein